MTDAALELRDRDKIVELATQGLQVLPESGYESARAILLGNIATALQQVGDWQRAIEYSQQKLPYVRGSE